MVLHEFVPNSCRVSCCNIREFLLSHSTAWRVPYLFHYPHCAIDPIAAMQSHVAVQLAGATSGMLHAALPYDHQALAL